MAKVSWRGPWRDLRFRLENLPEEMLDAAEEVMRDTVEDGAQLMRQNIATRGTDYSRSQGRQGRIETGHMHDSVESSVKRFRRSVRGEFGWGVAGGDYEKYFDYQENGFRHWLSGREVPPMHAFLDAFARTREEFFARMRREFGRGR